MACSPAHDVIVYIAANDRTYRLLFLPFYYTAIVEYSLELHIRVQTGTEMCVLTDKRICTVSAIKGEILRFTLSISFRATVMVFPPSK